MIPFIERVDPEAAFFGGPHSLGDIIISGAVVAECARRTKTLYIAANAKQLETTKTLFSDIPNVVILPFESWADANDYCHSNGIKPIDPVRTWYQPIQFNGMVKPHAISIDWERQVYENCGMLFSRRYSEFPMPKVIEGEDQVYESLVEGEEEYVLVHRSTGVNLGGHDINVPGFRHSLGFSPLKIIEVKEGITDNLMNFRKLIQKATEIHVVPSSFYCLVDSMASYIPARLFVHDVRSDCLMRFNNYWNGGKWGVVNYAEKY